MKFDAALHDKNLEIPSGEKKENALSEAQQYDIDKALEAAMIRKKLEFERGRPNHSN